jgi:hypothetical protein
MTTYLPLKYPDMKKHVVCTVERDLDFNGGVVRVGLALYGSEVYEVADCGYYHSCHFRGMAFGRPMDMVMAARSCQYYRDLRIIPCPPIPHGIDSQGRAFAYDTEPLPKL